MVGSLYLSNVEATQWWLLLVVSLRFLAKRIKLWPTYLVLPNQSIVPALPASITLVLPSSYLLKHFFSINFHRREHAQNKQQLESLIAEVDQMARDVDPSVLLSKRQGQVHTYIIIIML